MSSTCLHYNEGLPGSKERKGPVVTGSMRGQDIKHRAAPPPPTITKFVTLYVRFGKETAETSKLLNSPLKKLLA